MKKLFLLVSLIISSSVLCHNAFAALSASTVWEVRTAGAGTSGCGFVTGSSGTDYSQQDAAQISRTDLVIGNPATTTLTSAATPFTTAEIGNLIQITAGTNFTTGFYHISAVDGSNIATVDRAVGTAGSTGGTGAVGGACNHPNTLSTSVVAGNTIHIKAGTYQKVGANTYVLTLSVSGGSGTPIIWEGYNASRNDAPSGTNRPLLDGNAAAATNVLVGGTITANIFRYFRFADSSGAVITNSSAGDFVIAHSKISGSTTADGISADNDITLIDVECSGNADACSDSGAAGDMVLVFCYIHDNTNEGIVTGNNGSSVYAFGNVIESNGAGDGLSNIGDFSLLINNLAYNNVGAASDGFTWSEPSLLSRQVVIANNVSIDNGNYGFNRTGTTTRFPSLFNYNLYNGNATAGLNNITAGANDSTANPSHTNEAGGDFTYSASSSAGVGAGLIQSPINGLTGDYNWNMGVDQGDHTSAGGASAHTFVGGF